MKILYFLPHITNSGGMERIVMDKINYLVQEKYQVYLAYFGKEMILHFSILMKMYIDVLFRLIQIICLSKRESAMC